MTCAGHARTKHPSGPCPGHAETHCETRWSMAKSTFAWRFALSLAMICGVLSVPASRCGDALTTTARQSPASLDRRRDMVTTLEALAPHPSLGDQAKVFDRFVGTWDADYSFHAPDGSVRHSPGEVVFGWIMDGHALQDLFISYPKHANEERKMVTGIRFFDTSSQKWRVAFVAPIFNVIINVEGGQEGDRIVLRGKDVDGRQIRWSFNDITDDAFTWRGEKSPDGGRTWRLEEEHHMKRRVTASAKAQGR